jgi:glutamine amidotransferase
VKVSSEPKQVESADKLVLPGVGAFGDAARELERLKLAGAVRGFLQSQKPFLGICLGLQMLFETSEESPEDRGLAVFPGRVVRFRSGGIKIPHMGWNSVSLRAAHPFLEGLPDESFFYFVHSYYAAPEDRELGLGLTEYGEERFPAVLGRGNVLATQFHPEKSQEAGLLILKNFIAA